MVGVLQYARRLQPDVLHGSVLIGVIPIQPLVSKVAGLWERSLTNSDRKRLVPTSFGFLSYWGNPGPVLGQKVSFFDHCNSGIYMQY